MQAILYVIEVRNFYFKNCQELQIKTAVRYHFAPVGLAIIKRVSDHKCWQGCGGKRMLPCTELVGKQSDTAIMESSMDVLQEVKDRTVMI